MGYGSDMWMAAHERIGEDFASGMIDEDEARARLKVLGLDLDEIDNEIAALLEDRDS